MSGFIINPFVFATGGGGGDNNAIEALGTTTGGGSGWQYGWRFSIASSITVSALSLYLTDQDPSTHYELLRIWRLSDNSLMASASIEVGTGSAGWNHLNITPVELTAGDYVISARRYANNTFATDTTRNFTITAAADTTFGSGITYVGPRRGDTNGVPGAYTNASFFAVSFVYS